jgi:hypothetical protein
MTGASIGEDLKPSQPKNAGIPITLSSFPYTQGVRYLRIGLLFVESITRSGDFPRASCPVAS